MSLFTPLCDQSNQSSLEGKNKLALTVEKVLTQNQGKCHHLHRSSLCTRIRLCLHCGHMCRGIPVGVGLLLLPHCPDGSGTDYQGVVLLPSTLQSRSLGQPTSHAGTPLVYLLALSSRQITFTWWRNELQSHWIAGTQPIAAEIFNVNQLVYFDGIDNSRNNGFPKGRWQRRHECWLRPENVTMVFCFLQ